MLRAIEKSQQLKFPSQRDLPDEVNYASSCSPCLAMSDKHRSEIPLRFKGLARRDQMRSFSGWRRQKKTRKTWQAKKNCSPTTSAIKKCLRRADTGSQVESVWTSIRVLNKLCLAGFFIYFSPQWKALDWLCWWNRDDFSLSSGAAENSFREWRAETIVVASCLESSFLAMLRDLPRVRRWAEGETNFSSLSASTSNGFSIGRVPLIWIDFPSSRRKQKVENWDMKEKKHEFSMH